MSSSLRLVVLSRCQSSDCMSASNTYGWFHSSILLRARLSASWHREDTSSNAPEEAFANVSFWLELVVRTHWQLVKQEEGPASVAPAHAPFPTFQFWCFSWQCGKWGLSSHAGSCGVPVAARLPGRPAAAGGDVLNPNPHIGSAPRSPRGPKRGDSVCLLQGVGAPAPRGHRPFAGSLRIFVHGAAPRSPPGTEKEGK